MNREEILKLIEKGDEFDSWLTAKLRDRIHLDIGRSYLFKEQGKYNYFEGKVIKYGARDLEGYEGSINFALIKLLVDGRFVWWIREDLEVQEQFPSDHEDGY